MQLAVSVEDAPAVIVDVDASTVHTGLVAVTVTVALAAAPVPLAFTPANVYVVVEVGLTVHAAPLVPAQVPPVQTYDVAAGLQLAASVELAPAVMEAGLALTVQDGTTGGSGNIAPTH
jgi:hypothetical protein